MLENSTPIDQSVEPAWKIFRDFLRKRGARITLTRRIVLSSAMQRYDHFLADELAAQLATGPSRVSRGTVYRTLALLVEAGMVREIRDSDIHIHYEWSFGRDAHEHFVCDKCGEFFEFTDDEIPRRLQEICDERGFKQHTSQITIFGLCQNCRK